MEGRGGEGRVLISLSNIMEGQEILFKVDKTIMEGWLYNSSRTKNNITNKT